MKKVRKFKCISRKGTETYTGGFEIGGVYDLHVIDSYNAYIFHIDGDTMFGEVEDFKEVNEEEYLQLKVEKLRMELKETENTLREKEKYTKIVPIEELRTDVWYTYTDVKGYLISFTDVVRGIGFGYAAIIGNWVEEEYFFKAKLRRATEKEVETILFRIAKQRGFVEGVKFGNVASDAHGKNTGVVGKLEVQYSMALGLHSNNQWIMWKGKWSTPIKEETYIESIKPELPKINGHNGRLSDDSKVLIYGCAEIPVEWFSENGNRFIKNLTLSSGVQISTPNMDSIRKYLKYKLC